MKLGHYYNFVVLRISDLGYILKNNNYDEEILMHFRQSEKEYKIGDSVYAFLYVDKKKRLCLTDKKIYASYTDLFFAKCVNVTYDGVYLDINTSKDLLLSSDILPKRIHWPKVGDNIPFLLKEKQNILLARLCNKFDLEKYRAELELNKVYKACVFNVSDKGISLITLENFTFVFVNNIHFRKIYRIGEEVQVKIINKSLVYTGTLLLDNKIIILDDENIIINYLKNNNNIINITSKSNSDIIYNTFKMSRKQFKKALGSLYRKKIVFTNNDYTKLLVN